jgi:hypothetical protein
MRTLLAALLLGSLLFTTGCPLGCGAYSGAGDKMYNRGNDSLLLCENGGFVATVSTGIIEGRVIDSEAVLGSDGSLAFDIQTNEDGTLTTPQLGTTPWQLIHLDKTSLDHADVLCKDLETRPWWSM